jgi:hypothetical protein
MLKVTEGVGVGMTMSVLSSRVLIAKLGVEVVFLLRC